MSDNFSGLGMEQLIIRHLRLYSDPSVLVFVINTTQADEVCRLHLINFFKHIFRVYSKMPSLCKKNNTSGFSGLFYGRVGSPIRIWPISIEQCSGHVRSQTDHIRCRCQWQVRQSNLNWEALSKFSSAKFIRLRIYAATYLAVGFLFMNVHTPQLAEIQILFQKLTCAVANFRNH